MEQQHATSAQSKSRLRQLALGVMASLAFCTPSLVSAQEGLFPMPTNEVLTWSARACYVEATWSFNDCSALLHVIRKRAAKYNWSFLKMLKAYSYKHWQGKKGAEAKHLQIASVKQKDDSWNKKWFELVQFVHDVLDHNIEDPCPKADHWAAKWYEPKSPMKHAKCRVKKLENAFWTSIDNRK